MATMIDFTIYMFADSWLANFAAQNRKGRLHHFYT